MGSAVRRRDIGFSGIGHGGESFDRILLMRCSEGTDLVSLPSSDEALHEYK